MKTNTLFERRKRIRRKSNRRSDDRRRPARVSSSPGKRNVWTDGSGEDLLDQVDQLDLTIEGQELDGSLNPYDSGHK